MPVIAGGQEVAARGLFLAKMARLLNIPTWGTEQNPLKLGPNMADIRALSRQTFPKMHFNASESDLLEALRPPVKPAGNARSLPKHLQKPKSPEPGRQTLVVAGCEAHVCLLQTALGLQQAGLRVWVVAEACASRRSEIHALAMQRLQQAGVTLVNVEMVAFEWLRSCEHPRFRAVLPGLKAR